MVEIPPLLFTLNLILNSTNVMTYYDFILTKVYKEMSKVLCRSFGTEISEDIMHDFYTNVLYERGESHFKKS